MKAIYDDSKLKVAPELLEETEAFSIVLVSQMAANFLEHYNELLHAER